MQFSVDGRFGGDSNVLRSGAESVGDGFFEISPRLTVREQQSDLNYNFLYVPIFTTYFETDGIDGVDHLIRGSGAWSITPRDNLSANVRYGNRRQLRFEDADPSNVLLLEPADRIRIRRTTASLSYSRQFTPTWSGSLTVDVDDFDPSADNVGSVPDTRSYSGRAGVNYALDGKTSFGVSAAGRFRDTRSQLPNPSAKALIWDVSLSLSRRLSDSATISVQVGPSFISTEIVPDLLVRAAGGNREFRQDTSIFASVSFNQQWQKARFSLAYVRSEFRGGISASSTISDDVDLNLRYDFNRKTFAQLNAGWTQRDQLVDVGNFSGLDSTQWQAIATITHRLTRHLSVIGQYSFRNISVDNGLSSGGVGDINTGFLSLRYTFDPIIF